jgi:hypothetical protein
MSTCEHSAGFNSSGRPSLTRLQLTGRARELPLLLSSALNYLIMRQCTIFRLTRFGGAVARRISPALSISTRSSKRCCAELATELMSARILEPINRRHMAYAFSVRLHPCQLHRRQSRSSGILRRAVDSSSWVDVPRRRNKRDTVLGASNRWCRSLPWSPVAFAFLPQSSTESIHRQSRC